ncbi:MAG: carbohydrate ABC transporter permease [Lachnospiraceae bacterium]|jgi:putative aldouronate transport system permease protein|nr:carbohydrate ABC transporter permease [Lachnospiraceae bacterium]
MNIVRKLKKNALDIVISVILFFLSIAMLYPMMYELAVSLSTPESLVTAPRIMWFTQEFSTLSYELLFRETDVLTGYKNTLIIMALGLVINMVLTMILAYFLSRKSYKVKMKTPVTIMILITMYFSGGMIPRFLLVRDLGLFNSYWSVILPGAVSTYNAILLRSFYQSIPDSLEESAELDGAGHATILFKIYFPLSKPAMAVVAMYYGLDHWNRWFEPSLYLSDTTKHPLALMLRKLLINTQAAGATTMLKSSQAYVSHLLYDEINTSMSAALVVVATVPFLLIYPFLQKHFQTGIMIGSLKG